MFYEKNLYLEPLSIDAATHPLSNDKTQAKILSYIFSMGNEGGVAAVISRGPMTKFLLWFIFVHDFESYPSDRELSYDFS